MPCDCFHNAAAGPADILSDWACGADERAYEEADDVSRHARLIVRMVNQLIGWPLKHRDERSSNIAAALAAIDCTRGKLDALQRQLGLAVKETGEELNKAAGAS
jgi:hypothetical protein